MKTPSPQEAAKMTNEQIAVKILDDAIKADCQGGDIVPAIERALDAKDAALLEADKNGYERGAKTHFKCQQWIQMAEHYAKEDEALLRECVYQLKVDQEKFVRSSDGAILTGIGPLLAKLESRLAPSVGLSEGNESSGGPGKCVCAEPSPDRLVIHRADGPCYLRPREPQ